MFIGQHFHTIFLLLKDPFGTTVIEESDCTNVPGTSCLIHFLALNSTQFFSHLNSGHLHTLASQFREGVKKSDGYEYQDVKK